MRPLGKICFSASAVAVADVDCFRNVLKCPSKSFRMMSVLRRLFRLNRRD